MGDTLVPVGAEALEFELASTPTGLFRLSSLRDKYAVVLVFYGASYSSLAFMELLRLRTDIDRFEKAGVKLVLVSCDNAHVQRHWAEAEHWPFLLLSDFWPHGEVARRYGVFETERGLARGATFVIDKTGFVVAQFEAAGQDVPRQPEQYEQALAALVPPVAPPPPPPVETEQPEEALIAETAPADRVEAEAPAPEVTAPEVTAPEVTAPEVTAPRDEERAPDPEPDDAGPVAPPEDAPLVSQSTTDASAPEGGTDD